MVDNNSSSDTKSRRQILKATSGLAAAGLVAVGTTGNAIADQETGRFNDSPGRGGQSVLEESDYRPNQEFEITRRTGDTATEIAGVTFQCNKGNGNSIFLVGWFFQYTDSDEEFLLYTRSNNIDTDKTYRWNPNGGKICKNGIQKIEDGQVVVEDAVQTGYQAVGNQ